MAEPTFNPPQFVRRYLPDIYVNRLTDQVNETSEVIYFLFPISYVEYRNNIFPIVIFCSYTGDKVGRQKEI